MKGLVVALFGVAAAVALFLWEAFAIMIFIGILHGSYDSQIPTIGYSNSIYIAFGLSLIVGTLRAASRSSGKSD